MSELTLYSLIMLAGVITSSVSQVLLKKSARKVYGSKLREYLNPLVIIAYGLFFGCTLITVYALKVVPLSTAPVIEASGYIFVAVLSYIFFKEKLTRTQLVGMGLILAGIAVYCISGK